MCSCTTDPHINDQSSVLALFKSSESSCAAYLLGGASRLEGGARQVQVDVIALEPASCKTGGHRLRGTLNVLRFKFDHNENVRWGTSEGIRKTLDGVDIVALEPA